MGIDHLCRVHGALIPLPYMVWQACRQALFQYKKRVFCPWNAGTIVASGRKAFICPISLEFFLERKKLNYDITLKNA